MKLKRVIPVVLLLAVGGVVGWTMWRNRRAAEGPLVASGTVEATDAQLGFQVPGRLVEIRPREGDRVAAGEVLARLDSAETDARRAQALALSDTFRAQLAELEAGARAEELGQARAALAVTAERVTDAERDVERAQLLYAGRAIAKEQLDKATTGLDVARAQREQVAQQLRLVERGPRSERIDAARAQLAQAEAAVATLDATLANLRLAAPFAGIVTVRHREPGEIVPAGAAVLTLLDPADRWVRIYVPEDRLGEVALGAAATITADTFADKKYTGEVAYIASEAEFTPKNVQTTEERVRLVYAVKIRVTGDPDHELKPGLPADVALARTAEQ